MSAQLEISDLIKQPLPFDPDDFHYDGEEDVMGTEGDFVQAGGSRADDAQSLHVQSGGEVDLPMLFDLGREYLGQGNYPQAIRTLGRLAELSPSHFGTHNLLAMAYFRNGQMAEAARYLRRAVTLQPKEEDQKYLGSAYFSLGLALIILTKHEEAAESLETAISLGIPNMREAYLYLGHSLRELKRYEEAGSAFLKAAEADSSDSTAYAQLANMFYLLAQGENVSEAQRSYYLGHSIEMLRRVSEIDPQDEFAAKVLHLYESEVQTGKGQAEAFADAYTAAVIDERFANRVRLGQGYLDIGQFPMALEAFQKAFEEAGQGARDAGEYSRRQAVALTGYAAALRRLFRQQGGREADPQLLQEAERTFQMALEHDPGHVPAMAGLGELYFETGRVEAAGQVLQRALEIDPGQKQAVAVLSRVVEDRLKQRLHALGLLKRVRGPVTDLTPYENRAPLIAHGKPVSEIIIEERR